MDNIDMARVNIVIDGICFICAIIGVYGVVASVLAFVSGFPTPCDHNAIANITLCMSNNGYESFVCDLVFQDYEGIRRQGQIPSTVGCNIVNSTMQLCLVSICYGSYDPDQIRQGQAYFSDYRLSYSLGISGITCWVVSLIILCTLGCFVGCCKTRQGEIYKAK